MSPTTTRTVSRTLTTAAVAALLAACGSSAGSGEPAGPFSGQDVDLVVPYEPGGGYDAYARALAPYLEKCLDATIVVRNEPGAGGLREWAQDWLQRSDVPGATCLALIEAQLDRMAAVDAAASAVARRLASAREAVTKARAMRVPQAHG